MSRFPVPISVRMAVRTRQNSDIRKKLSPGICGTTATEVPAAIGTSIVALAQDEAFRRGPMNYLYELFVLNRQASERCLRDLSCQIGDGHLQNLAQLELLGPLNLGKGFHLKREREYCDFAVGHRVRHLFQGLQP